ncbi:MAG: hypothetical protein JOZ54_07600 [Acidobacteria bacterium]|nr:hypothetical protein [Acidobacteriota bacterium]
MKTTAIRLFVSLSLALGAQAQFPSVPSTVFSISGDQNGHTTPTAQYRAYQSSGDTFRIVCPEPCPVDANTIYAFYSGFKQAKSQLIQLMGVDSLPALQPFDIHVANDTWCGNYASGLTGDAGQYPAYSGRTGSFGCFWYANRTNFFEPFEAQYVSTVPYQLLTVHEYTHTLFYGRHFFSYEDFAKVASFYVSGIGGAPPITDACAMSLDRVNQGKLPWALCQLNGFTYAKLPAAMQGLASASLAGQNVVFSNTTSVYGFRKVLNNVLGSDTSDAFLAAKIDPNEVADDGTLTPGGGRVSLMSGWMSLKLPAGAVAGNVNFHVEEAYSSPAFPTLDFNTIYSFTPGPIALLQPVQLTVKYDPSRIRSDIFENTLTLYQFSGGTWLPVSGSRLDVTNQTVTATVTSLGTFGIFGSTTNPSTDPARVIVVAGSARGASGSNFRTALQLHNRTTTATSGKIVFHPAGVSASPSDPSINYALSSWASKSYADLLPAFGIGDGLGSIDVVPASGPVPELTTRVFNDGGAAGTSGFTEEALKPMAALANGDHGVLLTPPSFVTQRLNIGVRTFSQGATVKVTVRNSAGTQTGTFTKTYPPNFFEQQGSADFLQGTPLAGNDSIDLAVTTGSLLAYASCTDNVTNDPSVQTARSLALTGGAAGDTLYVPVVGSAAGGQGSFFKTAVQIHNPGAAAINGKFVFHRAGASGNAADPSLAYSLQPGETKSYADLPTTMGLSGLGSLDVVASSGPPPLVISRVFNDAGAKGTSGLTEETVGFAGSLQAGDTAVLIVPPDLAQQRMNIGIRTLGRGAVLSVVVISPAGFYTKTEFLKRYPPTWFEQVSAASFLENLALTGGETIRIFVESGDAILYGAATDNITNDPSFQLARRLPYF